MNYEMVKWGSIAQSFLLSAKFQAKRIADSGNQSIVLSDEPLDGDKYDDVTEANDTNLAIPTIYSFYHGLELLLKGALISKNQLSQKNHDLDKLFLKFSSQFSEETDLVNRLQSILCLDRMSEEHPVKRFCETNKLTPSKFYEALRYPENRSGDTFSHIDLKYNEENGAEFFAQMVEDIDRLMVAFVAFSKK